MKKLATSVGLVALSTSVLQAAETGALNAQQTTKPWSVSASLRGFYDDNIGTANANETESVGFQINPSVDYGLAGEQTSVNAGYALIANYYENQLPGLSDNWDFTHTFDVALSHTFSPRFDLLARNSFAIGQEPDVLQTAGPFATAQRVSGDNIRNYAILEANMGVTRLLGFRAGYGNSLYDYDDSGAFSNSALLDRMEHSFHLDSRWNFRPQTVGILGYRFAQTGFTGDSQIGTSTGPIPPPGPIMSDRRDSRSHTVYVGAEHSFTPDLFAQLNVGLQYSDYFNADETDASPYAQGSLTYAYRSNGSLEAGVTYQRSATDAVSTGNAVVLDAESAVLYGVWTHELIPHLTGSVNASIQNQKYFGGTVDGDTELYTRLGLNLSYEFSKHLSGNVGYNFDNVNSDIPAREYDRNRFYVGVTAAY